MAPGRHKETNGSAPRLERWAHRLFAWRRSVLAGAGLVVAVGLAWGTGALTSLVSGGFTTPGSESEQAARVVEEQFGRQRADVIVVYDVPPEASGVDDPTFADAVQQRLAALPERHVDQVLSTWNTGSPELIAEDGRSTLVLLQLRASSEESSQVYEEIAESLTVDGVTAWRGGPAVVDHDIDEQVERDLARAEMYSLPLVLLMLLVVFGSLAAASLPVAIGVTAIMCSLSMLRVLASVTDISIFAVNIVTMLGLGLAIDYALLIVSRFRDEITARGGSRAATQQALAATLATAGRTVLVSGATVAIALSALTMFPQTFLRSMGFGAVSAVVMAVLAALTLLPALLAVLGPRITAGAIPGRLSTWLSSQDNGWARVALAAMRRPGTLAVTALLVLAVLAAPSVRIVFGGVDERVLPPDAESRVSAEAVTENYPSVADQPITVVVTDPTGLRGSQLERFTTDLWRVEGVTRVKVDAVSDTSALAQVSHSEAAVGPQARTLVERIRALGVGDGPADILVGGAAAEVTDLLASIRQTLPRALSLVVLVTMVVLFLAFGSLVLPVKAVLMNLISLAAMFGIVTWVFQEGNGASLFDLTPTGTLEASQLVLMVAIAFGLSTDYEVFLLSRVREAWDHTRDNRQAVAIGVQQTGRIITSAALLLVIVIGAFSTSGISFIAMIGVGLALTIVLDATLIRMGLVPAVMALLGSSTWWLPGPVDRFWQRFRIRDDAPAATHSQSITAAAEAHPSARRGRHRRSPRRMLVARADAGLLPMGPWITWSQPVDRDRTTEPGAGRRRRVRDAAVQPPPGATSR